MLRGLLYRARDICLPQGLAPPHPTFVSALDDGRIAVADSCTASKSGLGAPDASRASPARVLILDTAGQLIGQVDATAHDRLRGFRPTGLCPSEDGRELHVVSCCDCGSVVLLEEPGRGERKGQPEVLQGGVLREASCRGAWAREQSPSPRGTEHASPVMVPAASTPSWSVRLEYPLGIARGTSGLLYVVESDAHRVQALDPKAFERIPRDDASAAASQPEDNSSLSRVAALEGSLAERPHARRDDEEGSLCALGGPGASGSRDLAPPNRAPPDDAGPSPLLFAFGAKE